MGILVLIETETERRFSDDEVELARGLGEQAAVAIRHAQLYRRQEEQNKRLLALLETSRVLAPSLDAGEVLGAMRDEVAATVRRAAGRVAVSTCLRTADGLYLPLEEALGACGGGAGGGRRGT